MSKFTDRLWRELVREHGDQLAQMRRHAAKPPKTLPGLRLPLFRPRMTAAFTLLGVVALNATGAFGLNVLGMHSALTATSLPSNFQSAAQNTYFFPTQTTCQAFSGGTAASLGTPIQYGIPTGKSMIGSTSPGVFFYWTDDLAPPQSSLTLTETEAGLASSNPQVFFTIAAGSFVYDANCNTLATISTANVTQTDNSSYVITVPLPAGSAFVGIKFQTSSVVGDTPPTGSCSLFQLTAPPAFPDTSCAQYTFTRTLPPSEQPPPAGLGSGTLGLEPRP